MSHLDIVGDDYPIWAKFPARIWSELSLILRSFRRLLIRLLKLYFVSRIAEIPGECYFGWGES